VRHVLNRLLRRTGYEIARWSPAPSGDAPSGDAPAEARPECVYLEVFWACNLRCLSCALHARARPRAELSVAQRLAVVEQVARWSPGIRLVFSGAEAFTRREQLYPLARAAADRGLYCSISTNGTLLEPDEVARLPGSGLRFVVVSLDSHDPAVHDRVRGAAGAHEGAVRTIRRLVAARDAGAPGFGVGTMSILGSHNLADAASLVAFAAGLGVDRLFVQPIVPEFGLPVDPSWWRSSPLFPRDAAQVDRGIDALRAALPLGGRMPQTHVQLEDMRAFLHAPARPLPGRCMGPERSLVVDARGDVWLCFGMAERGLAPLGNVVRDGLRDLWVGAAAARSRAALRACGDACGCLMVNAR
jgi:MoaA/NifB/PqqE/SkfB family radical SAM enzyme